MKAGKVHLAPVESLKQGDSCVRVPRASTRLEFNPGLAEAEQLADLTARIRQDLSGARIEAVGLVETRSYSNWTYRHAYARVLSIGAVMAATTALQIPFATLKTSDIAQTVKVPADKLQTVSFQLFGFTSRPMYWTAGLAEAFAGGCHLLLASGDPS